MPTLRLKLERVKRDLTLDELGKRAQVSPSEISRIERGHAQPYPNHLIRLAKALKVPAVELLKPVDAD